MYGLDFGRTHLLAPIALKALITSQPILRPKVNTTVNVMCMKSLEGIGIIFIVSSSVKGVRSGSLLSPDVHTKDNRLAEKMMKKIRDQANQTAGNAKKSHIFQYGGVEV